MVWRAWGKRGERARWRTGVIGNQWLVVGEQQGNRGRSPAPEPVFEDGKDAFHRVPFIPARVRDAVERVLNRLRGAKRINTSGVLSSVERKGLL